MLNYEYTINEIIFGSLIIFLMFYFTSSYNINLLQFTLIIGVVISILYISVQRKDEIKQLQEKTEINTNINSEINTYESKPLLLFIDKISYFKLYNPVVYTSFIDKINNYIKLQQFIFIHKKYQYKLYSQKMLYDNLLYQKKDIIDTFSSFEHTLDDRITSTYKLTDLVNELDILLK